MEPALEIAVIVGAAGNMGSVICGALRRDGLRVIAVGRSRKDWPRALRISLASRRVSPTLPTTTPSQRSLPQSPDRSVLR